MSKPVLQEIATHPFFRNLCFERPTHAGQPSLYEKLATKRLVDGNALKISLVEDSNEDSVIYTIVDGEDPDIYISFTLSKETGTCLQIDGFYPDTPGDIYYALECQSEPSAEPPGTFYRSFLGNLRKIFLTTEGVRDLLKQTLSSIALEEERLNRIWESRQNPQPSI